MSKNPQSKDEALEALDFIVNVLKEHERDLDKLISELATVTEQMGDTSELTSKVEKVEEKINGLQKEVSNLIGYVSGGTSKPSPAVVVKDQPQVMTPIAPVVAQVRPSVVLRCMQWEDFQTLAFGAQTLSFNFKEEEKVFQADALKGSQIITYSGAIPKFSAVLKAFLSKQLNVPQQCILEGVLAPS